jgi:taurine dioxygenase
MSVQMVVDANEASRGNYKHITVQPISGALGAEMGNVDVSQDLSAEVIAEIRRALVDHLVIFFRDQNLTTEQQKTFTRRFGEIFVHPNFNTGEGDPEIVEVLRRPGDTRIVGEEWHTDTTMMPEPPMGAILYAIEVPPFGGDTMFANQYLAYEALSDGMKALLGGMRAVHSDRKVAGPSRGLNARRSVQVREDAEWRETQTAHPIVRTHPESGRKCLFVNHSYTNRFEDMTQAESTLMLEWLLNHGHRPEFTCRFSWRPGSIAFWDNRCVKHIAINDAGPHARHMRRVQVAGEAPF